MNEISQIKNLLGLNIDTLTIENQSNNIFNEIKGKKTDVKNEPR